MEKIKSKTREWLEKHAESPRSDWILAAIAFSEAIFFPIPVDLFSIPLILSKRKKWLRFTIIAIVFSVLGAFVGYLLGAFFFDIAVEPIVTFYSMEAQLATVMHWFASGTFVVILISALTPIPYKVFALAAGIFGAPILPFIFASIIGRGIRFFVEGILLYKYGEKISNLLYSGINKYSLAAGIIIILFFIAYIFFK